MTDIYILKQEKNKYYIGKSDDVLKRVQEHFDGNGSEWTKIYKPIDIEKIISNCDDFDEDKYVLQYMDKYGINNVRGGSYSKINLEADELNFLQKRLNGANDKCYMCGGTHFCTSCPLNKEKNNINPVQKPIPIARVNYNKKFVSKPEYSTSSEKCFKCGRPGHYAANCFATTHVKGYYLKNNKRRGRVYDSSDDSSDYSSDDSSDDDLASQYYKCMY